MHSIVKEFYEKTKGYLSQGTKLNVALIFGINEPFFLVFEVKV